MDEKSLRYINSIRESELFDEKWYKTEYPDVGLSGLDPIAHYVKYGQYFNRIPNPKYDYAAYLKAYPDLRNTGLDPFIHFCVWGRNEDRHLPKINVNNLEIVARHCDRMLDRIKKTWSADSEALFLKRLAESPIKNEFIDSIKVSIILPTYNRRKQIKYAVDSVLLQTHRNWELIIVDDGSADGTDIEIRRYVNDSRIKYIKTDHCGVSAARNTGLKNVTGDYVFFLDSDNSWRKEYISRMLRFVNANSLDAAYCALALTPMSATDNFDIERHYLGEDFDWRTCLNQNYIDINAFCLRAELLSVGGFDENLKRLVDWDFMLRVTSIGKTAYAPFVGVDYYNGGQGDRITTGRYQQEDELKALMNTIRVKNRVFLLEHIRTASQNNNHTETKIAVVFHVYHKEVVGQVLDALKNIQHNFHLYVTTSIQDESVFADIKHHFPFASIYRYPNVGRDVGPFVELIPTIMKYELVCKIHTKRNLIGSKGFWRDRCINSHLGSKESIGTLLKEFSENKELTLAGPDGFYLSGIKSTDGKTAEAIRQLSRICNIEYPVNQDWGFFAGTMFWARTELLYPLLLLNDENRLYAEHECVDGQVEHALERFFGLLANAKYGAKIGLIDPSLPVSKRISISTLPFPGGAETITQVIKRLRASKCSTSDPDALADSVQKDHQKKNRNLLPVSGDRPRCEAVTKQLTESVKLSQDAQPSPTPPGLKAELNVLRIGYVVWDWPALSQTFVINEIRWLVGRGYDVKVYYKVITDNPASLDFDIDAYAVSDAEQLSKLLRMHSRTVMHSPFAYPATTLLTWPASIATGIPFSFMPGGVDISHYDNMRRNLVGEVASSDKCLGVVTLGSYHRDFLIEQGVPPGKIVMERQAVKLPAFKMKRRTGRIPRIIAIGRFIEKKGFTYLISAASKLPDVEIVLYGYGPLETALREQVNALEIKNFHFGGVLSSDLELHAAYESADIFVLPCVRASNGDLDGLPTVLLEAMAAGVLVISTRIANIPDLILDGVTGFLCPPADFSSLAETITRAILLPHERRERVIQQAHLRASNYANVDRTMDTLGKIWSTYSIDILLITYDTPQCSNWEDTQEIIDRIYRYTSMPFNLYIVDNNSQAEFSSRLNKRYGFRSNCHYIGLKNNIFCGPASNIGIEAGSSEYLIYVCSKECFILQHGWEREMVRAMDASPTAAIGGFRATVPQYSTGAEIQNYPSFAKWRNKEYASNNPKKKFHHIQGGLYILRRSVYDNVGGFNDAVPQDGMDLEYSYYLESLGYKLLQIENVYAISAKTLPRVESLLDEHALVVHPSSHKQILKLDAIVGRKVKHCNACGWQGQEFEKTEPEVSSLCPSCGAGDFTRTAYRLLSSLGILQKRPGIILVTHEHGFESALAKICRERQVQLLPSRDTDPSHKLCELLKTYSHYKVIIIDHCVWADVMTTHVAESLAQFVVSGGFLILGRPVGSETIVTALRTKLGVDEVSLQVAEYLSEVCEFDPYPVYWAMASDAAFSLNI